jgi:hypothetical protein
MYSYIFHIFKLNNLKVIHDLHSQCLTEILSKTTWFMGMEGVDYYSVKLRLEYDHQFETVDSSRSC